jgi:Ca2+-binding EF-hand superfamily protein
MWAAYDVFRSMDRKGLHKITRQDYSEALGDFPTVDRLKVLKRSGLENRFRKSPKEVTLEEFLRLMWPTATEEDIETMQYWAKLRDAQGLIHAGNFEGDVKDLRQVFDLLDKDRNHLLEYNELMLILSKQEIKQKMLEAEACRAEFKGDDAMVEAKEKHNARLEFKKLLYKGKSAASHLDQLLANEKVFENKLTFDEFCLLVQPKTFRAKSF